MAGGPIPTVSYLVKDSVLWGCGHCARPTTALRCGPGPVGIAPVLLQHCAARLTAALRCGVKTALRCTCPNQGIRYITTVGNNSQHCAGTR